ncbi:MAG: hypothetical protein KA371_07690 [Acidobacteria bacterium]|nr:hypothetical protein [Acidobacteriota bacterium]
MDVRDQLLLLWRFRLAIVGAAVVLGAAAVLFSLLRTRQFEATATVAVSASRLNDQTPAMVSPEGYVTLMTTQAVAAKVIAGLRLADLTPSQLLNDHITVRAVPNSNLVKVVARTTSADQAAALATRFAEEAVAAASRAGRIDVETIESDLKRMLDAAAERLTAAERAYDEYRTSARFELVEREVETLVSQRGELMDVVVQLDGERARLAKLESDLAKLSPVTPLRQAVVDAPALAEAARAALPEGRDLLGLEMTRELPNTVYANLDEEASKTRAHVAFLDRRRQRLAAAAGLEGKQLTRLTQLYERESKLEALDSERRLARDSYEAISSRHQVTRLNAVGRTPQLLVVDPAMAPDLPMSRYTLRNLILGVTAGCLLGCVGVLLREALAGARRA